MERGEKERESAYQPSHALEHILKYKPARPQGSLATLLFLSLAGRQVLLPISDSRLECYI